MKKLFALALAALALNAVAMGDKPDDGKLAAEAAQRAAGAATAASAATGVNAVQAAGAASAARDSASAAKAVAVEVKAFADSAKESADRAKQSEERAKRLAAQNRPAPARAAAPATGQVVPSSYQSLQPFRRFAKGEGEGYAYDYRPRTKAQFVALLRDPQLAKKEMRVTCDVLVRQMMEGRKSLPFEGCEGAAAAIERDGNYQVVACRDEMFQRDNYLAVTNANATSFGVWHRECISGEQVLVYKGEPLISLTCLNPAVPVAPLVATPAGPPASAPKPSAYALRINCMSDRPDGYWLSKYEAAKAKREQNLMRNDIGKLGMVPYWEVFTQAPFGEMLAERRSRPQDCRFSIRFLKKEPVLDIRSSDTAQERAAKYNAYLKQFQYPAEENVLTEAGGWVSTGSRGWVMVPITVPLESFEAVLVQPASLGEVLEPVVAVHRPEFATQSNPINIWQVRQ